MKIKQDKSTQPEQEHEQQPFFGGAAAFCFGGGPAAVSPAPQYLQKLASCSLGFPHCEQYITFISVPFIYFIKTSPNAKIDRQNLWRITIYSYEPLSSSDISAASFGRLIIVWAFLST